MYDTFFTVVCGIYSSLYAFWLVIIFWRFTQIPERYRHAASIEIGSGGFIGFIFSISWLIFQLIKS